MAGKYTVIALLCVGLAIGFTFYGLSGSPASVLGSSASSDTLVNLGDPVTQIDQPLPSGALPSPDVDDQINVEAEGFEQVDQVHFDRLLRFNLLESAWMNRDALQRKEKQDRLDELLRSIYGYLPDNPVTELGKLDADKLAEMLRRQSGFPWGKAHALGDLLADVHTADELLSWFEQAEVKLGAEGNIVTDIFSTVASRKSREIRNSLALAQRTLAILESYLKASSENAVSIDTSGSIWSAFSSLSPIDGGLELIRRWTIESPHGDEATETTLVELLKKWPLAKATPLILEVLETRQAGAIKGVVSAWSSTKKESGTSEWTVAEAKQLLESPLTEAVKTTKSSTAVLYAAIFTAKDILKPRAQEIADALLARRDNAYISSQGFSFLEVVDKHTANAAWSAWLESNNQYKMLAACMSAGNFREVSAKPQALNRMFELASKPQERDDLQSAAGLALCEVDSDYSRSLDILYIWLNNLPIADPTLVAAGRLVVWGPEAEVKAMLLQEIDDPNKGADERHYAMFLLAILDPSSALAICEDRKNSPSKLTEFTILLVAATAEGMKSDYYWSRAAALREACSETEPQWMKNIRFKLDSKKYRAEENIVGYAWSRPK